MSGVTNNSTNTRPAQTQQRQRRSSGRPPAIQKTTAGPCRRPAGCRGAARRGAQARRRASRGRLSRRSCSRRQPATASRPHGSEYEERVMIIVDHVMTIVPTPEFQRAFKHVTGLDCTPHNVITTIRENPDLFCRSGRYTPTLSRSPGNAGSSTSSPNDSRNTNQTSSKRRQSNERDSEARIDNSPPTAGMTPRQKPRRD